MSGRVDVAYWTRSLGFLLQEGQRLERVWGSGGLFDVSAHRTELFVAGVI